MANLATVLKQEIARLARKEARSEVAALKKHSAQYRRDIAALKRTVQQQARELAIVEKQLRRRTGPLTAAGKQDSSNVRFSPIWLKKHRAKLGLSAESYATLAGVSALSIYNWESGKTTPRDQQKAKLAAVRSLGKREAQQLLAKAG